MNVEELIPGDIARSRMGRDNKVAYVMMSIENEFAYCANGTTRKVDNPKKKRLKHLRKVSDRTEYMAEKIAKGEKITNVELRRELQDVE